jgi:hypothetical protein
MPGTSQNHVVGNFIGTDVTGSTGPAYAANYLHGVNVEDGVTNNFVYDNVIGNNQGAGVQICCRLTPGNQVYNNRIGISLNGTAIPNTLAGVQVGSDASKATIGPNNIITNNAVGIAINTPKSDFNTITRNSIYHNVGLGIDLTPSGTVNPNDAGDGDSGANQQLNFPVLTDATTVEVKGTACVTCTVEIFLADGGEGAYGEGKTFVGAAAVGSDGKFTTPVQGVNAGNVVTATATDANGNTSEFSRNRGVVQAPSEPTVTVYAADTFKRTITDGWGRANTGGAYTLTGTAANFDVNGNAGTILVPAAGTSRMASLTSVSARDVNLTVRVHTNKVATGGGQYAYLVARSVNSNTYYQGQLRFTATGSVTLRASLLVSGTSTALGSEVVVAELTHTPHSMINVRMQAVGTNPTTLRIKAWVDGQAEPAAWQYSVTDTSASLQTAGAVGLRTTIPSTATNAPVLFTFDDFRVTSVEQ